MLTHHVTALHFSNMVIRYYLFNIAPTTRDVLEWNVYWLLVTSWWTVQAFRGVRCSSPQWRPLWRSAPVLQGTSGGVWGREAQQVNHQPVFQTQQAGNLKTVYRHMFTMSPCVPKQQMQFQCLCFLWSYLCFGKATLYTSSLGIVSILRAALQSPNPKFFSRPEHHRR